MGEIGLTNLKGRQGKILNIQLSDLGRNVMNVTLWDEFAIQMIEYAKNNKGRIIVILKKGKIKKYQGSISVSNSLYCSSLLLNYNCPEIEDFRASFWVVTKRRNVWLRT